MSLLSIPFSQILAKPSPSAAVAFGRGGERRHADLRRDVSRLGAAIDSFGSGRWLFFSENSYAAAVALLALARCGGLAVLPPNRQAETLRRLSRDTVGVLTDTSPPPEVAAALQGRVVIDPLSPPGIASAAPDFHLEIDRDAAVAEFQTSGTTGEGRSVRKAWRHLEDEVATLEQRLGASLSDDTRIFATASHQHIYGLLFRVLWPLASGRPFQAETLLHSRELLPRMAECPRSALVTTPVHLKRMAASEELRVLRRRCSAVFSSGGLLDAETAKAGVEQLGSAPFEILGSTETGGVAVRQRDVHGESWEPLPGVEISAGEEDGRLEVTSPFVSVGENLADGRGRYRMGDRIAADADGGFLLLGRADRIVKIGEKRLSLPEMERCLETHPHVEEAAVLVLEQAGEPRTHAVVALSEAGRRLRAERREIGIALTRHLSAAFDPVLLPRGWRIVAALPRDTQDKVPLSALRALFRDRVGTERPERPTRPLVLREHRDSAGIERRLEVPVDLAQFEGHFDGFPVVAGVVQLGWVMEAVDTWLGRPATLIGLDALKFSQPLRPGDVATLRVEPCADRRRVRFELRDGERIFASGRCLLGPVVAP